MTIHFDVDLARRQLLALPQEKLVEVAWKTRWRATQHAYQAQPAGDWAIWLMLAGRGAGKTRTAGETLGTWAVDSPGTRWLVAAPTYSDLIKTCFEGESGLLNVIPKELIGSFNKSDVELKLANGSIIQGISAEKPERFRGPQFAGGWLDEFGAWMYQREAFDLLMLGMRLGKKPRLIISTTPRPTPMIRALTLRKDVVITRASTYDNLNNLAPTFRDQILQYEGTTYGRQEIHGELIDAEESGVIRRSWIKLWPKDKKLPNFSYIVMSLDTAFTEETRDKKSGDSDPTACSVWGLFDDNGKHGLLLLDCWEERLGFPDLIKRVPKEMAQRYGAMEEPLIKPIFGKTYVGNDGRKPDILIIEDKGSGISLRQVLEREQIFAYGYNPGRANKLERLHAVSHLFAGGFIWVPESKKSPGLPISWADDLVAQICSYTGKGSTEHDDFVDSSTQALRLLMDRNHITIRPPAKREDEEPTDYRRPGNPYG